MSISSNQSYLTTADEFITHWNAANTAYGSPISLRKGVVVADLQALREVLELKFTAVTSRRNDLELARGGINTQGALAIAKMKQFCARVRLLYEPDHKYTIALPKVPNIRMSAGKVTTPLDEVLDLWGKIDAEDTPIVLPGMLSLAVFDSIVFDLKTAYTAYNKANTELKLARAVRNSEKKKLYAILKQYREAIPSYFDDDSPIVESLPRLTPLPGSTPDPVNASAVWDVAEAQARIEWVASVDPHLTHYQVRFTPGPRYLADDAGVVANVQSSDPLVVLSLDGLTQPGAKSTYKVFVLTTTGNEAGSEAMTVTRPAS